MSRAHFESLTATRDFNRRAFIGTTVGSGFAAAVLPVSAQTITTDSEGLTAGPVSIPAGGTQVPAYRSMPAGRTNLPVVLVVHEIFGVHEHIADITRRLAKRGYLAVAPELFTRQGDVKAYSNIGQLMSEVVAKVPDEQVMGDLDATAQWAAANGGDGRRIGITGFCWGGRIAWLYAAHAPQLKAAVAWYGPLTGSPSPLKPANPIDLPRRLKAPVLGLYGGQDPGIPLEAVNRMKDALAHGDAAARRSEFVVYPKAAHAFNADYRPSYVKEAADDGWKRCLGWFKSHGVA